jgi:dTDP-4-amino-4,6-dideoxygalactose transaminase
MSRIHLSKADVTEVEEGYVLDAIRSGWVTSLGPHVDAFEDEVAGRVGVEFALALCSGTAALHLGLLGLGAGPNTVVLCPTLTFAASANAIVYTGARPVFVDALADDGNVDPELMLHAVDTLRREGSTVAAAMVVDLFGRCANYEVLVEGLEARGVPLLEDAAESLGATFNGQAAGSFGQAAALSFNGNKIMTTSGGGMVLTGDAALADRCRHLATQARQPVRHYEHAEVGYNYRLSNLLAALGRAQLRRLDEMIARRRLLRDRYTKVFASLPGVQLLSEDDPGANCWLTTIVVDPTVAGWHADELATHLAVREIETRPAWKPMHLQPAYAGSPGAITGAAEQLFEQGLTLPSGSALTEPQVDRVFDAIHTFLEERR